MGFIPILLTFGGFIFLFALVVNQSIKSKKEQYKTALFQLAEALNQDISVNSTSIESLESELKALNSFDPEKRKSLKILMGKAKLLRHQYNELIKTKPYSFVAKTFGYHAI